MGAGHSGDREVLPGQDRWRVRIRRVTNDVDDVLGGGILLGTQHVLTCAHILGAEPAAPEVSVEIDIVDSGNVVSASARIATGGWAPPNDEDGRDIALLELDRPLRLGSTTPLRRLPMTWERAVRTCGFPEGNDNGEWVKATLSGTCGPGGEWVQLDATPGGAPVRAGFSGAPVFDDETRCAIGMVVSTYTDRARGLSYMLPVETIVRHLPQVEEWVGGAKATDLSLTPTLKPQIPDVELARRLVSWLKRGTANILNIITGNSDSQQSATVRRTISLADREQRPAPADPRLAQAPEGTIPPLGSIDLAVDATGKTPAEVLGRIADRAGIPVERLLEPIAQLQDSLPPMTMVVDGIDDAAQPEAVFTEVLEPLADRGHRLLITYRRHSSPTLSIATSSPVSVTVVSHPEDTTNPTDPPYGSQLIATEWLGGGIVPLPVIDFSDPPPGSKTIWLLPSSPGSVARMAAQPRSGVPVPTSRPARKDSVHGATRRSPSPRSSVLVI